jgi:PAT family beta-lactamase induction signal transducer AmpG
MMGYVGYFVFVMVATIPSFLATWLAPFHQDDGMAPDAATAAAPETPSHHTA